ncbi:MAG: KOW domain-containing RNA-binding protein [Clostridiales bacterium]|nr:KOW domain-containing RNA-binding protein [Clostridiales bacterium]
MEVFPGDIVCSKAGRDKSGYFVVMAAEGEYARICDGRRRKTDKPKRKKLKHLRLGAGHSDYIENKLRNGEKVTNSELRRELGEYSEREC